MRPVVVASSFSRTATLFYGCSLADGSSCKRLERLMHGALIVFFEGYSREAARARSRATPHGPLSIRRPVRSNAATRRSRLPGPPRAPPRSLALLIPRLLRG